ncbi:DUF2845 domain-containing protein [Cellvibrio sp.]|uniref:DUF2845 domain-containing protein n=1 Tax=Cellvibrio sp. TaxID=1965322 RepID=UPI0039647A6C
MKLLTGLTLLLSALVACSAHAESLRCNGDIVEVGDAKVDVYRKCGEPVLKDSYCEKTPMRVRRANGEYDLIDHCEDVDVWTYNPGKGQFWTNLYFSQGRLREMRYGDRVQ